MKIEIYENQEFDNEQLKYAIIFSRYQNKWVFVKHKERKGWVAPSGHREENEDILEAAKRELYEETGATKYTIIPLFVYSVESERSKNYGKVFYAVIETLGELPESEIEKIELFEKSPENLTFPEVHLALAAKVKRLVDLLE